MADATRLIGIDFGTSTSVVCVKRYKDGKPIGGAFQSSAVTFGDGQGDTRAYTVARLNADGTYTCGRAAEDADPEAKIFREFKMDLESPDEAKSAQAKTLTEEFFKYLYRWYDHQRSNLGEAGDREKTIVSFPAKWTEETRAFMVEAARKAGFPDVSAMDEPSAALYATLTQNMNDVSAKGLLRAGEPGYMLLVDMGAGTTDLAVCRYTADAGTGGAIRANQIRNEIVSTWPETAGAPTFGGREVDRLLEDYLTDYMTSCGLDPTMARQLVCGTASVKPWKETVVSPRLNEGKLVDSCGFLSGYMMLLPQKQPFPSIDRAKLEELLRDKLEDFKSLVTGCLDKASELEPAIVQNGIDLVVLTGGHSAWYFTEELLSGAMPGTSHPVLKRVQSEKSRVMRLSNPQETVALGLVYSLLPMKVEKETEREQKKDATELVNVLNGVIEKKAEADNGRRKGPEDRAVPLTLSDRADRYFWRWVTDPANALRGWTVTCPVKYAVRWSYKQGREYTLSVTEEGVHIENMERSSEPWRKDISWEEFLSGQFRTIGFHVELQRHGRQDLCLAAIADYAMLKHLLKLLAGLQEELRGEASTHRQGDQNIPLKQAGMTYVRNDRLDPMAKETAQRQKLDELHKTEYRKAQRVAGEPLYQEALRFIDDWMGIDFTPNREPFSHWKPFSPERGVILWEDVCNGQKCNLTVTIRPGAISIIDKTVSWSEFKTGVLNVRYETGASSRCLPLYLDDALLHSRELRDTDRWGLISFLRGLHMRLWGNPLWRPTGPEKAGAVGHLPDGRKKDIADFVVQNRKEWLLGFTVARESTFRTYLRIPNNDQILLASMFPTAFQRNYGKDGWAITKEGIYARERASLEFCTWESFAGPFPSIQQITNSWGAQENLAGKMRLDEKWERQREEILDFFLALRTYVRGLMGMD